jgi:hypothetical protein
MAMLPLWAFVVCSRVTFTFTLLFKFYGSELIDERQSFVNITTFR